MVQSLTTEIRQHVVAGSSPVYGEVEERFTYAISRADEEKLKAYAFDPPPPRNGRQKSRLGFYHFLAAITCQLVIYVIPFFSEC